MIDERIMQEYGVDAETANRVAIRFFELLQEAMPDDEQVKIGDAFTANELDEFLARAAKEVIGIH